MSPRGAAHDDLEAWLRRRNRRAGELRPELLEVSLDLGAAVMDGRMGVEDALHCADGILEEVVRDALLPGAGHDLRALALCWWDFYGTGAGSAGAVREWLRGLVTVSEI